MDAIALLKKDHMTVKRLFERFERARGGKKEIADKIVKELAIHSAIEEQIFYPAVRLKAKRSEMEDADEQVLEALEEHHVAKWLLNEIDDLDEDAERFEAKVSVLRESILHHVKEEEGALFRFARRLFSRDEMVTLGKMMAKAKKMAPTKPHPRAPDQPPGNLVAGAAASLFDKGMDFMRDTGKQAVARVNGRMKRMRSDRHLNA
ncbi:MAG: hemerythrin domain-containing protein [Myxococcales bacterium]